MHRYDVEFKIPLKSSGRLCTVFASGEAFGPSDNLDVSDLLIYFELAKDKPERGDILSFKEVEELYLQQERLEEWAKDSILSDHRGALDRGEL